jgi:hypothetical protein
LVKDGEVSEGLIEFEEVAADALKSKWSAAQTIGRVSCGGLGA